MAAPFNPSSVVPIGIGALILWRFYSRARRMVGRQQLSTVRPWITVVAFPILTVLLAIASIAQPMSPLALAAGVLVGVCLGIYGLRKTPVITLRMPSACYAGNASLRSRTVLQIRADDLLRIAALGAEECFGGVPALLGMHEPHLVSRVGEYNPLIIRKQLRQPCIDHLQERVGLAA